MRFYIILDSKEITSYANSDLSDIRIQNNDIRRLNKKGNITRQRKMITKS